MTDPEARTRARVLRLMAAINAAVVRELQEAQAANLPERDVWQALTEAAASCHTQAQARYLCHILGVEPEEFVRAHHDRLIQGVRALAEQHIMADVVTVLRFEEATWPADARRTA